MRFDLNDYSVPHARVQHGKDEVWKFGGAGSDGEEDWFRQQFTEGAGSDLFYVSEVEVEPGWEGRNVELALVRQLCDTIAQGCELAVVWVESEAEAAPWLRLGFTQTTDEGRGCFLHLQLGHRQARVMPAEDGRSFRVVPNPPPGSEPH